MLGAIARKIGKHHRAKQTPHGRQTVRQLMGHGAATNSIEVEAPALFDRVARKWNVDYAFYQVAPDACAGRFLFPVYQRLLYAGPDAIRL